MGVVAIASIAMLPLTIASRWHIGWMVSSVPPSLQYFHLFLAFFIGFFGMYLLPAVFFWRFCKWHMRDRVTLLQQIRHFSVDQAQCTLDSDRTFVEVQISEWFGDIPTFEKYVRTDIARHVTSLMEKQGPIPYSMVVLASIGHILMCISYSISFLEAEEKSMKAFWHIVMAACLLCFCADAIAVNLVLRLASTSFGDQLEEAPARSRKVAGPVATAFIFGLAKAMCGGLITPACPWWWCIIVLFLTTVSMLALYQLYPKWDFLKHLKQPCISSPPTEISHRGGREQEAFDETILDLEWEVSEGL